MNPHTYEGAGFIFVNQNYDFLLVQDTESKKWGMCKGHRDQYEADPLATAFREAQEELGLVAADHYDVISGPIFIEGSPREYIFYYAMLKVPLNCIVMQKEEVCDIKWVRYHDLPNTVCNKDEYNIYLRLLVSTTIGKPTQIQSQQKQQSKPEVNTGSSFVPKYRLIIQQQEDDEMEELREQASSCILEMLQDDYDEDEVNVEPPPSAIDMTETYTFVPITIDMAELLSRSFSRPILSPSPRPRSCSSPFIPIGYSMPSPRIDERMSPFIAAL